MYRIKYNCQVVIVRSENSHSGKRRPSPSPIFLFTLPARRNRSIIHNSTIKVNLHLKTSSQMKRDKMINQYSLSISSVQYTLLTGLFFSIFFFLFFALLFPLPSLKCSCSWRAKRPSTGVTIPFIHKPWMSQIPGKCIINNNLQFPTTDGGRPGV